MARDYTPTHAVEMHGDASHRYTPAIWPTKHAGRPTAKNLAAYIRTFEDSTQFGGVNAHLGVTKIVSAQIVKNDGSREVVAHFARQHRPTQNFLFDAVDAVQEFQHDLDAADDARIVSEFKAEHGIA